MADDVYRNLAKTLDSLPNGFPATDSGIEIKLLQRIFRPEDAELFCDLRLAFETAQQISERTGRPLEGLEAHLVEMGERGQISSVDAGGVWIFKMVPWAFGIYEFQRRHMDREMAEMCEAYMAVYGEQFFSQTPQLMQVVPIEMKSLRRPGTKWTGIRNAPLCVASISANFDRSRRSSKFSIRSIPVT